VARTGALEAWCNRLAHATLPSDYQILEEAGLSTGHPWAFLADLALVQPGAVAYYRYLYGVAGLESPRHVLEIGTAFGMGGAAIIEGAPQLERLVSLDLGVFTTQYQVVEEAAGAGWTVMERYRQEELPADGRNIAFAREVLGRLVEKRRPGARLAFYQVNTQPEGTDNFDAVIHVPRWSEVDGLVRELQSAPFDLLFIDGKHTGDGLYQDFKSFFPFVRPGGLVICDDVHDSSFAYDWAGQSQASFERALREFEPEIEDWHVWAFPQLPDWLDREPTVRPWGLVRKRGGAGASAAAGVPRSLSPRELAGLDTAAVAQRVRFLRENPSLLAELEANGFVEYAVAWLRLVNQHAPLFRELEKQGLPAVGRRLEFMVAHEPIFRELEARGLAPEAAAWLRFVERHPVLLRYLGDRPSLAADADRHIAEVTRAGKPLPNVRLLWRMLPRWLAGKYKFSRTDG
jgi:predicted O-methyltransferase YrrM